MRKSRERNEQLMQATSSCETIKSEKGEKKTSQSVNVQYNGIHVESQLRSVNIIVFYFG